MFGNIKLTLTLKQRLKRQLVQNYSNEGYYDIVPDDNAGNGYGAQINSTNYKLKMRANGIVTVTNRDLVRLIPAALETLVGNLEDSGTLPAPVVALTIQPLP